MLVTRKQEIAVGIDGVRLAFEQWLIHAAIQRGVINGVVSRLGGVVVDGLIEEVLAVGKKEWPAMRRVLGMVKRCDGGGSATVDIYAEESVLRRG